MSRRITVLLVAVVALSSTVWLGAQGQAFQFIVSATDASGEPVADLKPEDVVFTEKAGKGTISKVEPFALPVKVTIAVDNGSDIDKQGNPVATSALALPNYRNGLKGFVEAFPANTEMTLITTSPQPRTTSSWRSSPLKQPIWTQSTRRVWARCQTMRRERTESPLASRPRPRFSSRVRTMAGMPR